MWKISIHALLTESDIPVVFLDLISEFQSTLSSRRATCFSMAIYSQDPYFNPRSPHGERQLLPLSVVYRWDFNPRSPHGERPRSFRFRSLSESISIHALLTESDEREAPGGCSAENFNPRSPHGERRDGVRIFRPHPSISIHALLTESDPAARDSRGGIEDFNPRSPHGERRGCAREYPCRAEFQSTLSSRRATRADRSADARSGHFNPRSPHGERRRRVVELSIRRTEFQSTLSSRRATGSRCQRRRTIRFQSTLSSRRATYSLRLSVSMWEISIHALLTESDAVLEFGDGSSEAFQSTLSSRRATRNRYSVRRRQDIFQSTLSSRRATIRRGKDRGGRGISIHALLTESDSKYHQIGPIVSV